ncbi:hypothetical protein SLA2020_408570 [Shorea laevis]
MENMGDWKKRNLIYELTQGREFAKQLQLHLNASSSSQETLESLTQRIYTSYEKALSILKWNTSVAMEVQTCYLFGASIFSSSLSLLLTVSMF